MARAAPSASGGGGAGLAPVLGLRISLRRCVRCLAADNPQDMLAFHCEQRDRMTLYLHTGCLEQLRLMIDGVPLVRGDGAPPTQVRPVRVATVPGRGLYSVAAEGPR